MKVTFIMPSVGKKPDGKYVKSWLMEPLGLAILSALTPSHIDRVLYDDRLEAIPYDEPTNLVAINVETYTAKRAYQIAKKFRERNVPVVMGGYHPTLVPNETAEHADAVVIGEAELIWQKLLEDLQLNKLQKIYETSTQSSLEKIFPDRSLFKNKKYMKLTLIETGRGCRFQCEFCSINAFYQRSYKIRPIEDIVHEIKLSKAKNVFFVDDNIVTDRNRAVELFKALIPLRIRWISQASMHIHNDNELLNLMKKSGCSGVLIGFESLHKENLEAMGKQINDVQEGYERVVRQFHSHKIAIYGTFVFGYNDSEETFKAAYDFAVKSDLFYAAFNHLVPFPGTVLYERLAREERLLFKEWWLDSRCTFGNVYFKPNNMTPEMLEKLCYQYRYKFFSIFSIFKRGLNYKLYWQDFFSVIIYYVTNFGANQETKSRQHLPMGSTDG